MNAQVLLWFAVINGLLLFSSAVVVYFGGRREGESWNWAWVISTHLARHIGYLELLLKLMFVNPPDLPEQTTRALPVRWHPKSSTHTHTDHQTFWRVARKKKQKTKVHICYQNQKHFIHQIQRIYRKLSLWQQCRDIEQLTSYTVRHRDSKITADNRLHRYIAL